MKTASAATLAILAAGQYLKVETYAFALVNGNTYYFTAGDAQLTVGGATYMTGLTIVRQRLSQKMGLEVPSVDLNIAPWNSTSTQIGGLGFLSACRAGFLDGARVTMSKGFFNLPAPGSQIDTSPGLVPWFVGRINELQAGRQLVDLTINGDLELLNVQMPRNILCPGCIHTLFDVGCGLSQTANTYSATVTSSVTALGIYAAALTQASQFFSLGTITFTSGVLAGLSYTVSNFAGGSITSAIPWSSLPAVGDAFTIIPGCDRMQATCSSGKFKIGSTFASNLARFRGAPYVPQPETLYDGGTTSAPAPTLGGQGGQGAGSSFSGGLGRGTYKA